MSRPLTLGSLFDGSGGFPLGALLSDIQPVWASEIEPFPIRVTTKRLPFMRHLGDVNAIHGAEIPPVDIITAGSPCTDVSCAGLRAGIEGKHSSLFFQAIRVIKEMREATHGEYPRYFVFENVPGLFSSGDRGADFKAVLDAIIQVKEPDAQVPAADAWPYADVILGDGWSVAYRVIDAQHFGVAQRRKRLYLVADFGSERAGDILFEREGVSRDFAAGSGAREGAAGGVAPCAGASIVYGCEPGAASRLGGHYWKNLAGTLRADAGDNIPAVVYGISPFASEGMKSSNPRAGIYKADTARTLDRGGGRPDAHQGGMAVVTYAMTTGEFCDVSEEIAAPLMARDYKDAQVVNTPSTYAVRRLTPRECAMLQGFPPDWCMGLETPEPTDAEIEWWAEVFETHRRAMGAAKKPKSRNQIIKWLQSPHTDSAEYKLWGNGVSLPIVVFVLRGIDEVHKGDGASLVGEIP